METGETFGAFTGGGNPKIGRWLLGVLAACAEDRRWLLLGEGTWHKGHWTRLLLKHYDALRTNQLGQWLVPMHKNTRPWATLHNVSALQGGWMTGLVGNCGLWIGQGAWTHSSFGNANEFPPYRRADHNERRIPYTCFLRQWPWAISQGAMFCSTEDPLAFSREGRASSTFAAVKAPLNTLYPADPHGNVAYSVEVDDSFFVLNGNENRDVDPHFKLPLGDPGRGRQDKPPGRHQAVG